MALGIAMARFTVMGLSVTGGVQQNLHLPVPGVIASLILVLRSIVIIQPINKKVFLSAALKINCFYFMQDLSFIILIPPAILVTFEKPFCVSI